MNTSRPLTFCGPFFTVGLLSMAVQHPALGDDEPPAFSQSTYVYKTVDELTIEADVYRRETSEQSPVVVWLHGGALLFGNRSGVPQQLLDLAREHDFVVVSLDYRLAPEAKLPEIIEDLNDGLNWVRGQGPQLFHADPARMVVAGASAGGYLALMSGTVDPPPTAIVSYWGFGDILGDWTTQPNEAYLRGNPITEEDARAGVGGDVVTNTTQGTGGGRATFFLYLKQTGRWTREVSGLDPEADEEELVQFCPIRQVSEDFPPTLFLHGTADTDVPVSQSIEMAEALEEAGVQHELITIEGGGHSLWGGDRELIEQAFRRSMEYIREKLVESRDSE